MNDQHPASQPPAKNAGWPPVSLVGLALCGLLLLGAVGCSGPASQDGDTAAPPAVTQPAPEGNASPGALEAARVLASAIADKDEAAYASVWDNGSVVGNLYEPFIAEVLENSPGFKRLAVSQGRGDDVEGLLREAMPKDNFVSITDFNIDEWAEERIDLSDAVTTGDASNARVAGMTTAGLDVILVMEVQSDGWKVVAIDGGFRDLFVKNMGEGFDSVMPE